jgi:radical SAM superfamily enzyme YgiQ (UPF0313 family)
LLSLNWHRAKDPRTPLGTAYLYSWLSQQADLWPRIQVGLLDATVNDQACQVAEEALAMLPDLLGIGVYVWNNSLVRQVVASLRAEGYRGKIVLGGPEISYATDDLRTEFPGVDFFVKGEGEVALEEIVRATLEQRNPEGLGIYTPSSTSFEGQSHLPPGTEPVQPQSLPELLPLIVKEGFGRIEFQRGCLFACSFCAFPFKDRVFTEFGMRTLRQDLRRMREAGIRELAVLDPIFFHHKERAKTILRALAEELPNTRLEIQSRLEHLDSDLIEQLSHMNVRLECGVQSLDPQVQAAIHRGGKPEVIEASLGSLRDSGVEFEVHLIFGLPYQTKESLVRDADYLLGFRPRRLRLFPLLDHRGTTLSRETQTVYRDRLTFSDTFPRQIEETRWMPRETVAVLKRAHLELEEGQGARVVLEHVRALFSGCQARGEPIPAV